MWDKLFINLCLNFKKCWKILDSSILVCNVTHLQMVQTWCRNNAGLSLICYIPNLLRSLIKIPLPIFGPMYFFMQLVSTQVLCSLWMVQFSKYFFFLISLTYSYYLSLTLFFRILYLNPLYSGFLPFSDTFSDPTLFPSVSPAVAYRSTAPQSLYQMSIRSLQWLFFKTLNAL